MAENKLLNAHIRANYGDIKEPLIKPPKDQQLSFPTTEFSVKHALGRTPWMNTADETVEEKVAEFDKSVKNHESKLRLDRLVNTVTSHLKQG